MSAVADRGRAGAPRAATEADHQRAVERVIAALHERFADERLSLRDMAGVAWSSPYHFERVFRRVTRLSPGQFLTALRMNAAKRLLATTPLRVTDVCFEVGYSSLGTFTRRFSELVGLSPRDYRLLAHSEPPVTEPLARLCAARGDARASLQGVVEGLAGALVVGLFATPLPQGRPLACAFLPAPGAFAWPQVADGAYFAFATTLDERAVLAQRAVAAAAVQIVGGVPAAPLRLSLRPPRVTDPPVLVCLPWLVRHALSLPAERPAGAPFQSAGRAPLGTADA